MNEYLSAMTDIIEEQGGFVDKYIGDAIVAVFGAPLDDPDHATHAVHAALRCAARLPELGRVAAAFNHQAVRQRIGLNSGEALVGNIGSQRRFNYTVMGDMVNLASRLESANRFYGTTIMASAATMALTGSAFLWREIDAIRVKGRTGSVKVFEPLGIAGKVTAERSARALAHAEGLARLRARDFAGAAEIFVKSAEHDQASALFAARALELARCPPDDDWDPVNTLDEK
jgi:adenylate cyclase